MGTDRDLLTALQRGDQDAWDEAFRRLYPAAFAAARHPLASLTPTEAEDIAIEALTLLLPKIKEVAAALGFDSPANFGKVFKRWYGLSPGNFRSGRGRAAGELR